MGFSIDEKFVAQTLTQLVQFDSRNPSLCPDSPGEKEIGILVADLLNDLGLQVHTYPLGPKRMNVIGVLPGTEKGRSLMLNGHLDTVGVEGMVDPFSGEARQGRVYGRGSQDMKGSLAAMLGAVKALVESGITLQGDLIFAAVADEEDQSLGTMDLIKYHHADAVIVTEPTDLELVLAHRGFIWYQVETIGRAVHGSRYQEGIDAIAHMGRFIAKLDRLASQLLDRPPHPLVGPPSLHAAKIKGGTDSCTYAARCTLHIDRRTIPGEDEPLVTQELWEIIDDLSQQDPNFQAKLKALVQRAPLETNSEAEIVEVLTQALSQEMGKIPIWSGAGYWSDAALLAEAGLDAVLLGPVGDGLHSTEEWVDVKSVFLLARVLAETARLFCGEEKDSPGGET